MFLDKEYPLTKISSAEFQEYYELPETQNILKTVIEADVLNNISTNHIPNEVDFEYDLLFDYKVFKIDDILNMYDLINS